MSAAKAALLLFAIPAIAAAQQDKAPSDKTGIDPTDIRTRIEAAYTYNERANGVTRQNINVRLEREFAGKELNIRVDLPYIYADIPDASSQNGLGDIGVRLNYRYRKTSGHSALVGVPVVRDLDDDETITLAVLRVGKVFGNGSVAYLGTRVDLSGNADDDLVATLGYRYLFD